MWKIFFQDTLYGTVSLIDGKMVVEGRRVVDGKMVVDGDRKDGLTGMMEHYRKINESDAELVAGIDQRLHGRWTAVPIDQSDEAEE